MFGRDLETGKQETDWAIALMEKCRPAIWTLENVEPLHRFYKGRYPTAYVFKMWQHCKLAQDRRRLVLSNKPIFLPRVSEEHTMRECLGKRKGWDGGQRLWCRNAWGYPRSIDGRSPTVTSGYLLAGAQTMGELGSQHILDSGDRALLQGYEEVPAWPKVVTETARKRMVAQCVPPPFARELSIAAFEHQQSAHHRLRAHARMVALERLEEDEVAAFVASGMPPPADWMSADVTEMPATAPVHRANPDPNPSSKAPNDTGSWDTDSASTTSARAQRFGKHGRWKCVGKYGWCKASIGDELHIHQVQLAPWLICHRPPEPSESHAQFRARRSREKLAEIQRTLEGADMHSQDFDCAAPHKPRRAVSTSEVLNRHFTNISPDEGTLRQRDANAKEQLADPSRYGPYLLEGEQYKTLRTRENWEKACKELGLDELEAEDQGERAFYADLVWDLWILFDDKLRPIHGVEVDLDLSGVKPIRAHPYRWSPAKVAAGRKLIQEFVEEGIMEPITSEWGAPALVVPKPSGGWRLVIDLRELNRHIPHDTYEPPSCDLCLEWLSGRRYRTTADMRWGFHQVLLSERARKIFTLVTPFGTYAYKRLVMGYINATAEFQRHMNNTLGPALWDYCLSMVDDVIIGSETKQVHRVHVASVFTRLAQRGHAIKPTKGHILRKIIEYLGHESTPFGTRPTKKHITAIMDMPPPLGEIGADGIRRADKTKVRSFLGFAKYQRRYIKNCGLLCGPLNELTTDNSNGIWTSVHTMVFNRIKRDVANTRGVWHADFKLPFYVCSDGSKRGLGGYLFQMVDGEERIISYFSRSTTREEREWDTRELELLAMICTLEYFRHYVEGQKLFLQTDHRNLTWLANMKGRSDRLGRWVLRLSNFPHELSYRKGVKMNVADCMSRNSVLDTGKGVKILHAGTHMEQEEWQASQTPSQGEATPAAQCVPCMLIEQLNPGDSGSDDLQDQAAANLHVYAGALGASALWKVEYDVRPVEEMDQWNEYAAQIGARDRATGVAAAAAAHVRAAAAQAGSAAGTRAKRHRQPRAGPREHADRKLSARSSAEDDLEPLEGERENPARFWRRDFGGDFESLAARHRHPTEAAAEKAAADSDAHSDHTDSESDLDPSMHPLVDASESSSECSVDGEGEDWFDEDDDHQSSVEGMAASAEQHEPLVLPECLDPQPVGMREFAEEQAKEAFCKTLMDECKLREDSEDGGIVVKKSKQGKSAKFALFDGVLYRVTEASDPKEGYDSARVVVPESLRERVMNLHHVSVWGAHRGETATFKDIVASYYWPAMATSIHEYVRHCKWCELAKGTKPSRQGFAYGWRHNAVNRMVTMDLIGPMSATSTGHVQHKAPFYMFTITDPFSHMLWLETVTGKGAEEIYYKFIENYLLQEGAPMFVLTDNGGEFKNELLKELMRLLKVRLHFTPSYHPRGNYTERVNRFIGGSLRTMLNMEGARKADWFKLVKFVQFAYCRMHIPGTNLTPYMVARGRQPSLPLEIERQQLGDAIPDATISLNEHVLKLNENLVVAAQLLRAARAETLSKSREKFNQHQIEVTFSPGERIRLWKRVPVRHGDANTKRGRLEA